MSIQVQVTPSFIRYVKKLQDRDKLTLDEEVKVIMQNPRIGVQKKGDLSSILVHKFKMNKQEAVLAYRLEPSKENPEIIILILLGSHENFYRELKK